MAKRVQKSSHNFAKAFWIFLRPGIILFKLSQNTHRYFLLHNNEHGPLKIMFLLQYKQTTASIPPVFHPL